MYLHSAQLTQAWEASTHDRNVRIHIPVGIAYGSDIALAQGLMIDAAAQAKRVLQNPKPSAWLKGFGDSFHVAVDRLGQAVNCR